MRNIDYYIAKIKDGKVDGGIEDTKAYRFEEDGVILVEKPEAKFNELKEKIDICKSQGINITAYYDYKKMDNDYYILEELAKGTEFAHLINNNPNAIKILENIPYSHIEKYIKDAFLLEINGIGVEPRRRNIFYDKKIGFTVIDVSSMKKSNIENMNMLDVYYFFNMYNNVIPHSYEENDYEKNISNKILLNLIKAFENGHPLFKKYERWILRKEVEYYDFFIKNGIDLTLSDEEIKQLKNYIEEYIETEVDKNMNEVYREYNVHWDGLMEFLTPSINFCSRYELFGDDNMTLQDYIKSSVIKKLIERQRILFPSIFENREKGYNFLEKNIDKIPNEEMEKIKIAPFIGYLIEKYENKQMSIDEVMEYYYEICLVFKKIINRRLENQDNYCLEDCLNSLLDLIPADDLINRIKDSEIEKKDVSRCK